MYSDAEAEARYGSASASLYTGIHTYPRRYGTREEYGNLSFRPILET